jgi:hypothetical protein
MSDYEPISDYSEGLLKVKFADVASHLTGRPVRVEWHDIVYGADGKSVSAAGEVWAGRAMKSADGIGGIIHIRRGLGWDESYHRVFLHECAHLARTYKTLSTENPRYFTRKHTYTTSAEYASTPDEKTADQQASIWAKWARKEAGTSMILYQLDALLKYPRL